jgi:hypothetical protein
MVKKDAKAKAAEKKARVAAKVSKKAVKTEKKTTKKSKELDSDAEDEADLDAVLAEYAKQQETFLKVSESVAPPPSARSSATLTASPLNDNELFLFGGEYFNGQHAKFWNELFVYNISRDEWRLVTSPNSPLPRSGHAWTRGGNDKGIYLFGGEFSSPKQGTFYHYNDFWRLEPSTREWTKLSEGRKGPPARSGHRMTYFKKYILLYGGFQDTSSQTKYLNDLWIYDTEAFAWHQPTLPPASAKPDARSSFSFLPNEQGAVVYGGYSRVKTASAGGGGGKAAKGGGSGPQHAVLKPLVHQDTWILKITSPAAEAPPNTLPTVRWERRKRPANQPAPARAGATMAHHRGRGIQFGGVHDVEESEEGIDSEFFNTLFAWNIDRNRYFSLSLRKARAAPKRQVQNERGGRRGRGKADEEDLLRNLAALETKGSLGVEDDGETTQVAAPVEEEDEEEKIAKPVLWEMPHPRFNAQLAVQDDVLYIYGGTFEKGDREYTFDEMYVIDLGKLDGVREVFRREPEDWQGSDDEWDDDEDDDEDDSDSDDEDNDEEEAASKRALKVLAKDDSDVSASPASTAPTEDTLEDGPITSLNDNLPHPRPFESLKDFFVRSGNAWQEVLINELKYVYAPEHRSIKELRKVAFDRAEQQWWDDREEIRALEDEAEEAGIGDVVSLVEKGASAGVGRRR